MTLSPTQGHEQLATDLFDHYGSLRPEFIDHPLRRGSGIWGDELSEGNILLIEEIHVEDSYRRQSLARRLVSLVFDKAVPKCTYPSRKGAHMFDFVDEEPVVCFFAMAWAKDETTATFWHANVFRRVAATHWFCKAGGLYPSSSLAAADDFYHPSVTLSVDEGKFEALPVYGNLRQDLPRMIASTLGGLIHKTPPLAEQGAEDSKVLSLLQQYAEPDTRWEDIVNLRRNTVLHLAAIKHMPKLSNGSYSSPLVTGWRRL